MLVLPACSGADAATPPPEPAPTEQVSAVTPTTPDATATTTMVPTTTPSTTESTTEPEATTDETEPASESPSTTDPAGDDRVDEEVQARLDVIEAVGTAWQVSLDIRRDPLSERVRALLAEHYTGGQLAGWRVLADDYANQGLRLRPNPEAEDAFEIELASLAVDARLGVATVQVCEVVGGTLVRIDEGADASDVVVDDVVETYLVELEVVRVDSDWKVEGARVPTENEAIATCA